MKKFSYAMISLRRRFSRSIVFSSVIVFLVLAFNPVVVRVKAYFGGFFLALKILARAYTPD